MCMSINKDVSHIVAPSESGVQLIVLKTTHDSVIVKTRNLQAPSRYLRLADLHKLITRQLNPSEKIFEFTKILTNFYINPVFQDLFQEIGVIQRVHTRFHSCESETESIESSDEKATIASSPPPSLFFLKGVYVCVSIFLACI